MSAASRPAATLRSVARAAGVHASTVSRALNDGTRHLVAADVAERIREVAAELGYRSNPLAASLRTRRSRTVGVLVPDIANPVFGPILSGIEAVLAESGYLAFVANAGSDDRLGTVLDAFIGRRVEGLILATVRSEDDALTRCLDAGIPTVLVNRAEARQRVSAVMSDDVLGLELAVRHLASLGHRRIAHLAGPQDLSTGELRRRGYENGMREAGLEPGPVVVADGYNRQAGQRAAGEILERGGITAIATANDLLALGAYSECEARGLLCPDDVSITGHNDMPLVDIVSPPLTTVRIDQDQLGRDAARILLARLADPLAENVVQVTRPELILRGSTTPPAGRRARR